jgi:hypothetical protein
MVVVWAQTRFGMATTALGVGLVALVSGATLYQN